MKQRIWITNWVIVSALVLFTLLASGTFYYILHDWHQKEVLELEEINRAIEKRNKETTLLIQMQIDISQMLSSVDEASYLFDELVRENRVNQSKIRDIRDLWLNQIRAQIRTLEKEIEGGFNDKFRTSFNELMDKVAHFEKDQFDDLEKIEAGEVLFFDRKYKKQLEDINKNYQTLLDFKSDNKIEPYRDFDSVHQDKTLFYIVGMVLVGLLVFITFSTVSILKQPINRLRIALNQMRDGNLPDELEFNNRDYSQIAVALNFLTIKLRDLKNYAVQIGQGNFDNHEIIEFTEDGELGTAFFQMQKSLEKVAEEDQERTHINQGLSKFSEILGNNTNNLELFGNDVILNLVKFLKANQGALFVVNDDDKDDEVLELIAGYAYEKKKYLNKRVVKGQGLVGQAWIEGKRIYMTTVPEDYVSITSGLGYSTPRCILIVPLIFNEEVQGVIELASFNKFKDYELGFIEKVSESISSALSSVKINTKTQQLLAQSKELTEQMKVQEDEMRFKVQELRVTQEESQRREELYLREIRRLKKRIEEYETSF